MGNASGKEKTKQGGASTAAEVEAVVGKVDDMKDGEMKEVDVGEGKALLVRENGQYYAVSHKCTHFGAPLAKGALCEGQVRCPWHGACFNVTTGDIEDFPGLDSLHKFQVEVRDQDVVVKANENAVKTHKRVKEMACCSPDDNRICLLIGGGAASLACAETLRQQGFKGKVIMATREQDPPYDRTKLSKSLDATPASLALREPDFYSSYDIEVLTGKEAISVNTSEKTVSFQDGSSQNYTSLLIATGGSPRQLDCEGHDLENVCLLRTPADGNRIIEQAKGRNVVVIGTSFIGMEVAASLVGKAASVSVIGRSDVPFKPSLGPQIGERLMKLSEEKGVKFYMNTGAASFAGEDGKLKEVVLRDGERLPADVCVVGAGVLPSTGFLADSGIELSSRGHVVVDKCMKTSAENVYAAGDIVEFPLFMVGDEKVNIGHWQMAHKHGRTAGLAMAGVAKEIRSVPFFWTMMYGKSLRYCGYAAGYDDIIIDGSLEELNFIAYYLRGDQVVAVAGISPDPVVAKAADKLHAGNFTKLDIVPDPKAWYK